MDANKTLKCPTCGGDCTPAQLQNAARDPNLPKTLISVPVGVIKACARLATEKEPHLAIVSNEEENITTFYAAGEGSGARFAMKIGIPGHLPGMDGARMVTATTLLRAATAAGSKKNACRVGFDILGQQIVACSFEEPVPVMVARSNAPKDDARADLVDSMIAACGAGLVGTRQKIAGYALNTDVMRTVHAINQNLLEARKTLLIGGHALGHPDADKMVAVYEGAPGRYIVVFQSVDGVVLAVGNDVHLLEEFGQKTRAAFNTAQMRSVLRAIAEHSGDESYRSIVDKFVGGSALTAPDAVPQIEQRSLAAELNEEFGEVPEPVDVPIDDSDPFGHLREGEGFGDPARADDDESDMEPEGSLRDMILNADADELDEICNDHSAGTNVLLATGRGWVELDEGERRAALIKVLCDEHDPSGAVGDLLAAAPGDPADGPQAAEAGEAQAETESAASEAQAGSAGTDSAKPAKRSRAKR